MTSRQQICIISLRTVVLIWAFVWIPNALSDSPDNQIPISTISLDQCIRIALENNVGLISARGGIDVSRERIHQTRKNLWPSLSMAITDNSSLGDSGAFSQYDPSTGQRFVPGEGFQASGDLTWSLYDFGNRRAMIDSEIENLQLREISVEQIRRDIIHQVIANYLEILERKAELSVRSEQLTQATESLKIAVGRLEIGSGIAYEVLLEEAYLSQAEADLEATEFALKQAVRSLLLLMRTDVTQSIQFTPIEPQPSNLPDGDTLMTIAVDNRLEFKKYHSDINAIKLQLKTLLSARRPALDLKLSYSQQGQNYDSFSDGDISWTAGLSFRFSPFADSTVYGSSRRNWINSDEFMQNSSLAFYLNDGTSTKSREIELRVTLRQLELEFASLRDAIQVELSEAHESFLNSVSLLTARQKNLAATEENERIQQKRYELGLNQYKDVVDARTDLVSARIALTRAMYSMEHYRMNLEYVLGLLEYQEMSE